MRYVVTGGAGFIGSNTVDDLVRRGDSVVVLDDLSSGKEENLAEIRSKISFIKGSITDLEIVRKAMHEADYVLHLAARASVPRSVKDPLETNKINVEGTLNVLVAARDAKVKRVVFAASSSAYGETPTLPKVESMSRSPSLRMACRNTRENSMRKRLDACTAWKTFVCATSTSLDRGRIPLPCTRAFSQSSAPRFWKALHRWSSAMGSNLATSLTLTMRLRQICSPAKRPMFPAKLLTSGWEGA